MKKHLLLPLLLFAVHQLRAQDRYELKDGWKCLPVANVTETGTTLSNPGYKINGWMPAVVPGTVLTTQLFNKQVPDPFYGMNNQKIPDIYTTGIAWYTYWFVKDFNEPFPAKNKQVWLHLRGVNYSCDVFVNGHKINDSTHKGMFLRQAYNITSHLRQDGNNRLAVIVYPADPPGNPNGGQGGDGMIAKNVTHQYAAGWDWIQPIRDRNTGIWDKVYIERTGNINLKNPHIVTLVPGIRKPTGPQAPAIIKVTVELENTTGKTTTGTLQYVLEGKTISKKVSIEPNSTITVSLPDYTLNNPRLWWPNGYGKQNLYTIALQFLENDKTLSDKETVVVGIREITKERNTITSSAQVLVNGQRVFIKGGNWIISDAMLRFSDQRYDAEIRFHRDMNLNLIRIWGGAIIERPEFYAACDKYGLLVFQDFAMSGDCNGRWNDRMKLEDRATRRKYPDDHALFLQSAVDQVKMVRNHPSLAIWCGGNEITPPDDILAALKDSILPQLDGTRWFVEFSNSDSMSHSSRGNGDGPYEIQPIDTFWKFRTYPFNSEVGSVGMGDYESLERFIPKENMISPEYTTPVTRNARAVVKVDSIWDYHKYIGYNQYINAYGPAADARDFANKAQLINYDQYRSLSEGFSGHMWEWYTGFIIWKTQNPWTAMRGQMYDYYLDPNACLYGLRSGAEPLHVMYNPIAGTIMVVNNSFEAHQKMTVMATAWNMEGQDIALGQFSVNMEPGSIQSAIAVKDKLDQLRKEDGVFLSLQLSDSNKQPVSENFYWLPNEKGTYAGLMHLKTVQPQVTARKLSPGKIEVTLTNRQKQPVAFFNRLSLADPITKKRILPVFYSDNYISVLPGKQKKVLITYTSANALTNPLVTISGWNVREQFVVVNGQW